MRSAVLASLLTVAAARPPLGAEGKFDDFVHRFRREYASAAERLHRFEIFAENLAKIEAVNAKGLSYKLGVTAAADLTFEEFRAQYLTGFKGHAFKGLPNLGVFRAPEGYTPPDSVDWVAKGGVTPVQNQAHCGSCWTFSTTGALEGATFVSRGTLPKYSEQNILDCDKGGSKCKGGSMDQAFGWVKENGICMEKDYPYQCADQNSAACANSTCSSTCKKALAPGDVTGYTDVDSDSEGALEAAVAQQPVSVAIEADKDAFQHYVSGVLTGDACGTNLDHGVLAVGYGTDGPNQYWKVKNSWGETFGENGFIRLAKGIKSKGGECGIRKMASYPTVTKSPGPAPGPAPGPKPGPIGCEDQKDYCKYVKSDGSCPDLASECLKTCGCCVDSPPDFCTKTPTNKPTDEILV